MRIAAPAPPPLADAAVLAELVDAIGAEAAGEVIGAYRASAAEGVETILQALSRGDLAAAGRQAHALRSSSALVGARALSERIGIVEQAARLGDRLMAQAAADGLAELLAGSLAKLDEACAALAA